MKKQENKAKTNPSGENTEKGKFLDSKGRVFGVISIIDVVAILGLIALCFGFYLKNNVLEATGAEDVDIQVTILMEIIEPYLADAILVGDELYDHDHATGGPIGIVTSKEVLEPHALVTMNDGTYQFVTSDTGVNVLITVDGSGSYLNGRYSFNRVYELGVNAARYFESKYVSFIGTVIDISTIE